MCVCSEGTPNSVFSPQSPLSLSFPLWNSTLSRLQYQTACALSVFICFNSLPLATCLCFRQTLKVEPETAAAAAATPVMAPKKKFKKRGGNRLRNNHVSHKRGSSTASVADYDDDGPISDSDYSSTEIVDDNTPQEPPKYTKETIKRLHHTALKLDRSTFYFLTADFVVSVTYDPERSAYLLTRWCRRRRLYLIGVFFLYFPDLHISEHLVPGKSRIFAYLPWSNQLVFFFASRRSVALVELNFEHRRLPPPKYIDLRPSQSVAAADDDEFGNDPAAVRPLSAVPDLQNLCRWNAVTVDEEAQLLYVQAEVIALDPWRNNQPQIRQMLCIIDVEDSTFTPFNEELNPQWPPLLLGPALFLHLLTTRSEGINIDERHLIIGIKTMGSDHLEPQTDQQPQLNEESNQLNQSSRVSLIGVTHLILSEPPFGMTTFTVPKLRADFQCLQGQAAIHMIPAGSGLAEAGGGGYFHLMTDSPALARSPSDAQQRVRRFYQVNLVMGDIVPDLEEPSLFTGFGVTGHYGPCSTWRYWREWVTIDLWNHPGNELYMGVSDYRLVADVKDIIIIFRKDNNPKGIHFDVLPNKYHHRHRQIEVEVEEEEEEEEEEKEEEEEEVHCKKF